MFLLSYLIANEIQLISIVLANSSQINVSKVKQIAPQTICMTHNHSGKRENIMSAFLRDEPSRSSPWIKSFCLRLCKKLKLPEESFCTHGLKKVEGFLCRGSKTKISDNSERFLDITLIGHLLLLMLSESICKEWITSLSQNEKCLHNPLRAYPWPHCALLISCCDFLLFQEK